MVDREVELIMDQVGKRRPDAFEQPLNDFDKEVGGGVPHGRATGAAHYENNSGMPVRIFN